MKQERIEELLKGTPYEGAAKGYWAACHMKHSEYGVVGFDITTQPEGSVNPLCRYEWGRCKSDANELEANSHLFRDAKLNAARVQLLAKALYQARAELAREFDSGCREVKAIDAALDEAGITQEKVG